MVSSVLGSQVRRVRIWFAQNRRVLAHSAVRVLSTLSIAHEEESCKRSVDVRVLVTLNYTFIGYTYHQSGCFGRRARLLREA